MFVPMQLVQVLPLLVLVSFAEAHTSSLASHSFRELYGFGTETPHLTAYPSTSPKSQRRQLEGGKPTLIANVSTITGLSTPIAVHYNDVEFTSANDWIGMWPLTDHYTLFSAPLKFKYVCEECRHWKWNASNPYPPSPPPNGTIEFNAINRRLPVVFIYVHGTAQFPESIARSQNISIENSQIPQGGHLSLVRSDPTKMRLQWSSDPTSDPHVKYGTSTGKYDKRTTCCNDQATNVTTSSTSPVSSDVPYTIEDMCDRDVQPAGLHGWYPPPSNFTAIFDNLKPSQQYFYVYGSDEGGWSDEKIMVAPPVASPIQRTVIAAFGDMGNVETDGSYHHSWDFGDRGEIPSSNTTLRIQEDKDIDMVLHIGDISYACGFLSEWDNFFGMIEPVASSMPWMTAIGNHEQGFSGSSPFPGTDSGGECGVPYNAYFPFASQNPSSSFQKREPWYDFAYGNVHVVVFSTEHEFTPGSVQHMWLERTLASVDRKITPWLMIAGHRPMYVDTQWPVADTALRAALEALFHKYNVDVAIWGHNHSYQRSCSVNDLKCISVENSKKKKCLNDGKDDTDCSTHGIQHFVIGMAGYAMNPVPEDRADFMVVTRNDTWGYLKMDFQTPYVLKTEFISDVDGSVVDTFTLTKPKL